MPSTPEPQKWYVIMTIIQQHIPAIMLLIPLLFEIIGLLGIIWYVLKIIKYNSTKYNLVPLIKSFLLFFFGLFLNYIRLLVM